MRGGGSRPEMGFRGAWARLKSVVPPEIGEVDQFYGCPGVGRSGREWGRCTIGGVGGVKTGGETCLVCRLSRSVFLRESGPVSLSVVSAAITRLTFPRSLVGSTRWCGWRASTEGSLAEESICTRRFRVRPSRARVIAYENHFGE